MEKIKPTNRNRMKRKLSSVKPDSEEFEILVRKSQLYREALGEAYALKEQLRAAHMHIVRLRNTLYQLKLAALGAITDVAVEKVRQAESEQGVTQALVLTREELIGSED